MSVAFTREKQLCSGDQPGPRSLRHSHMYNVNWILDQTVETAAIYAGFLQNVGAVATLKEGKKKLLVSHNPTSSY